MGICAPALTRLSRGRRYTEIFDTPIRQSLLRSSTLYIVPLASRLSGGLFPTTKSGDLVFTEGPSTPRLLPSKATCFGTLANSTIVRAKTFGLREEPGIAVGPDLNPFAMNSGDYDEFSRSWSLRLVSPLRVRSILSETCSLGFVVFAPLQLYSR
jgi:hypothetical protein